mmetsp:Transcript_5851/g.15283  ORF Transcript_5851/g.15283 Transcript_5851/m.15283 type:complete len:338 (-) Transcript_5851:251-1264(-)
MGATFSANLRNCDFATDGSPSSSTLTSPRRCMPSLRRLRVPEKSRHATAAFTSSRPQMDGAIDLTMRSRMSPERAIARKCSSSSAVKRASEPLPSVSMPTLRPTTRRYGSRIESASAAPFLPRPLPSCGLDEMTVKTPVTVTRWPGVTLPTRWRSTISLSVRGMSPVGTVSGASCSLSRCWSTKSLSSGSTWYESSWHLSELSPSVRGARQTRGSGMLERPCRLAMRRWCRQLRQTAVATVTLGCGLPACVMMPGMCTSRETCDESISRIVLGLLLALSKIWIAGMSLERASLETAISSAASVAAFSNSARCTPGEAISAFVSLLSYASRWSRLMSR